jgi:hypothetical protein
MIDDNTKLYKIGRSKNHSYREKTLQSEKPTIEMILNIQTSIHVEKELHEMFKHKRIRGEWFNLTYEDLKEIKDYITQTNNTTPLY